MAKRSFHLPSHEKDLGLGQRKTYKRPRDDEIVSPNDAPRIFERLKKAKIHVHLMVRM